jgi:hypothetical protein
MAVLSAPVAAAPDPLISITTLGIVFPDLEANVLPAPAYSGNEGQGNQSVGYATD